MSARFLDGDARTAFAGAVTAIEDASALEVVIAVRRRSAGYRVVNALVGALVAFAGLATMLYAESEFSITAILIDPFLLGVLAGALVELTPVIKRVVMPTSIRDREVHRAARSTFIERGVHNTRDRSGLLVYISWLEQRVALVADSGLSGILPAEAIARVEAELSATMSEGGAAVAKLLQNRIGKVAPGVPRRADDINELPDAIDSDLAREDRAKT